MPLFNHEIEIASLFDLGTRGLLLISVQEFKASRYLHMQPTSMYLVSVCTINALSIRRTVSVQSIQRKHDPTLCSATGNVSSAGDGTSNGK